jgi:hypothetical protein
MPLCSWSSPKESCTSSSVIGYIESITKRIAGPFTRVDIEGTGQNFRLIGSTLMVFPPSLPKPITRFWAKYHDLEKLLYRSPGDDVLNVIGFIGIIGTISRKRSSVLLSFQSLPHRGISRLLEGRREEFFHRMVFSHLHTRNGPHRFFMWTMAPPIIKRTSSFSTHTTLACHNIWLVLFVIKTKSVWEGV